MRAVFHDGCTAGPLSYWLNGMISRCCDLHDLALDHSSDLGTFVRGNWDFALCTWQVHPWLAPIVLVAVSGPVGLWLYLKGPKRSGDGQ